MITTYKEKYKNGELRLGWSSWDKGRFEKKSIKYAYKDKSGKISRGSPELPIDVIVDMMIFAAENGVLYDEKVFAISRAKEALPIPTLSQDELVAERKELSSALVILKKLQSELPFADFQSVYDQIETRKCQIKQAIDLMAL